MLEDIIKERQKKLELFHSANVDVYPACVKRTITAAAAITDFNKLLKFKKKVFLVGRIMGLRDQGNLIFTDITDASGKIQSIFKKDALKNYTVLKKGLDIGDFVEVGGVAFLTKKGEKSIEAREVRIISKSVLPLPSEWYGVKDVETRLRKRYLDILLNNEAKGIFIKKAKFWNTFRSNLNEAGFLEVETPVLESIPGGAEAEPFKTHHNALNEDYYLRISLELPLKKLLVAGYEKVFEIGRIFRNEGIDKEHLQDYTQLEFYSAYEDYNDLMKFVEKLYKDVIKSVCGKLKIKHEGVLINWGSKWPKVYYCTEFKKVNKIDPSNTTREELINRANELKIDFDKHIGIGRLIDLIFKKTVRPKLIQPCFLIDPPVEIEPLAKRSALNPKVVERMQVIACGTELGKGFSELNNPEDQRKRFEDQMKLREGGDKEAQRLDEEYLEAMEYGMPPASGFGVSERLFAVIMDISVREAVIFPLMRAKNDSVE
ncbi:MAG: lysine--tRNA ligase [bacterium]|nr:lysine--tRNA ligase [bacterium]